MRRFGIAVLILLPLAGAAAGRLGSPALARVHRDVRLADLVEGGAQGRTAEEADMLRSHRLSAEPAEAVLRRARAVEGRFAWGGALLGAWVGLVVLVKALAAMRRSRRVEYEVDQAACLACGRCYRYCPRERLRWKEGSQAEAAEA